MIGRWLWKHAWLFGFFFCLMASACAVAGDSGVAANLLPIHPSNRRRKNAPRLEVAGLAGRAKHRWSVDSPGRTGDRCISIQSESGSDAAWTAVVRVNATRFTGSRDGSRPRNCTGPAGATS